MNTDTIKEDLITFKKKNKLQYPNALQKFFEENAGLTEEELTIFRLRSKGMTVLEISMKMQELYGKEIPSGLYGTEKVERRLRSIKNKIADLL